MKRTLLNFIAFQAGWFALVVGAAYGQLWPGMLLAGLAVAIHLALSERPGQEARLIVVALSAGLVCDSLLAASGWLRYASPAPGLAPYWILAMWALFATTLNVSMRWLKGRIGLAALMGAVFGPLSYIAGQRLGALEFIDFQAAVPALAIAWALAMPLLILAAARFDGIRGQDSRVPPRRFSERVTAGD